jgi:hypothetical protein
MKHLFLVALLIATLATASDKPAATGHHRAAVTGVASLDVVAAGNTIDLLYAETAGAGTQLFHVRSRDAGATWTLPTRVDAGQPPAQNAMRGMDPQIAARGDALFAVWMTKGTGLFDSGPMVAALSTNAGRSWTPGPNPADDGSTAGHAFADAAFDAAGALHLVWLDSRDGRQGLRYANSANGGRAWSRNVTLKSGTCECCWNQLATGGDGSVFALFRDKEPRDMAMVALLDGGSRWRPAVTVGRFDWNFQGCPHVGGGMAVEQTADGATRLHALVWSGADGRAGVHHLQSSDGGRTWSAPVKLCDGSGRRGDIAVTADGTLVACWDAFADGGSQAWMARRPPGGGWSKPVALSQGGVSAGYPRVVATATAAGTRIFWTENGPGGYSKWQTISP